MHGSRRDRPTFNLFANMRNFDMIRGDRGYDMMHRQRNEEREYREQLTAQHVAQNRNLVEHVAKQRLNQLWDEVRRRAVGCPPTKLERVLELAEGLVSFEVCTDLREGLEERGGQRRPMDEPQELQLRPSDVNIFMSKEALELLLGYVISAPVDRETLKAQKDDLTTQLKDQKSQLKSLQEQLKKTVNGLQDEEKNALYEKMVEMKIDPTAFFKEHNININFSMTSKSENGASLETRNDVVNLEVGTDQHQETSQNAVLGTEMPDQQNRDFPDGNPSEQLKVDFQKPKDAENYPKKQEPQESDAEILKGQANSRAPANGDNSNNSDESSSDFSSNDQNNKQK